MGTNSYPQRVARSPWTPNPRQSDLLAMLKRAAEKVGQAEAEYRALLADCKKADIPIARLAEELKVERKTIYRHLGHPMK